MKEKYGLLSQLFLSQFCSCSFYVGHIKLRCDASLASQPRCIREEPFHRECRRMGHALHELQSRYGT